jgi:hypothetical protein
MTKIIDGICLPHMQKRPREYVARRRKEYKHLLREYVARCRKEYKHLLREDVARCRKEYKHLLREYVARRMMGKTKMKVII